MGQIKDNATLYRKAPRAFCATSARFGRALKNLFFVIILKVRNVESSFVNEVKDNSMLYKKDRYCFFANSNYFTVTTQKLKSELFWVDTLFRNFVSRAVSTLRSSFMPQIKDSSILYNKAHEEFEAATSHF